MSAQIRTDKRALFAEPFGRPVITGKGPSAVSENAAFDSRESGATLQNQAALF
jgi:hypothetical protein